MTTMTPFRPAPVALVAAYALLSTLFCPVVIGSVAFLVFGSGSVSYSLVSFGCFLWGAARFVTWWANLQAAVRNTIRYPRETRSAHHHCDTIYR